jgi:hypothetical protein
MNINLLSHLVHAVRLPVSRRGAFTMASALGISGLLGGAELSAGKKGRKHGKGKKRKRCRGGRVKLAGRCVRVCDVGGLVDPELCGQGGCSKAYANANDGQPYVCIVPASDPFDCEALQARLCLDHGDCGKRAVCVVSVACGLTYCAPIDASAPA